MFFGFNDNISLPQNSTSQATVIKVKYSELDSAYRLISDANSAMCSLVAANFEKNNGCRWIAKFSTSVRVLFTGYS